MNRKHAIYAFAIILAASVFVFAASIGTANTANTTSDPQSPVVQQASGYKGSCGCSSSSCTGAEGCSCGSPSCGCNK